MSVSLAQLSDTPQSEARRRILGLYMQAQIEAGDVTSAISRLEAALSPVWGAGFSVSEHIQQTLDTLYRQLETAVCVILLLRPALQTAEEDLDALL